MLQKDLFVGVNRLDDPQNLSDLEKKHLPIIDAPDTVEPGQCFQATVEVGRLLAHPNEPGHFIEFIDLYADDTFLARLDLTAVTTCPKAALSLALPYPVEELRAYERCNIHGVWLGTRPIRVRELGHTSQPKGQYP